MKDIFLTKKDILLPVDNNNNNVIVFKLIPINSFIIGI
jgi:hypothetical protein